MPSYPYTLSGMDPTDDRNASDPYGTGTIAGENIGIPGPNTGGKTARARPNQPSLGPPAGPKPPTKNPTNGAQQPKENLPALGVVQSGSDVGGEDEAKTSADGQDAAELGDAIGSFVQEQFTRMRNDRIITDELLLRCLYSRKGEYTPAELALMGGGGANAATGGNNAGSALSSPYTYFPITGTKCRAGEAWIQDIFAGTEDRLWTITPTPVPNVPDYVKELVVQQVKTELQQFGPVDDQSLRQRIKQLRDIAMTHVQDAAKQACERMTLKIEDQLDECRFESALSDFVADVLTFPYAVLKGPVVKNTKMLEWDGAKPTVKTVATLHTERVSPFDYYFSQYATTPQEGNIVELMHMTRAALYNCIGLPNFNDAKIREVLQSYPTGYKVYTQVTTQRQQLERNTYNNINANELIDTFDFWGAIPGDKLKAWGMKGIDDVDAMYEVNAWVVNGICMRAVMNPDPMKKRPYYVTSYEKVPGALVGRSVPMLMRSNAEIINSAYRALRRNMGLASGPFAEVDITRLGGAQAPEEIRPAMVKAVEPDLTGSNRPAYTFHDINSHAQEIEAVINEEIKKCDDVTGIPAYSYGNAQVAGAGRTVGGLAMLMGNASKGIKKVISNIEEDVLEPMVQAYYNYNMLYTDDPALKVDAQVVAKGPTGVILKEAQVQRRMEALQVLGPYIPTGIIPKDGLANLLRQILTGLDLDVDKIIPDPEQQAQLQALAQQGQQGNGTPGSPPGLQVPPPSPQAGAPGGPPNNVLPMRVGANSPHMIPPPPLSGTVPGVMPDRRSGPAGPIVAAQNQNRI